MHFVSLDIETLGLDSRCSILEVAMVYDSWTKTQDKLVPVCRKVEDCPQFHTLVQTKGPLRGEPYAMRMHFELLERIHKGEGIRSNCLRGAIETWLHEKKAWTNDLVLVGKNVQFDLRFLARRGFRANDYFHHRQLDIGSLFFDPKKHDVIPSTEACAEMCGINIKQHHRALPDAQLNLKLLRKHYGLSF